MTEQEYLKALDCLYDDDVFEREVWGFVPDGDNLSCADVENAKKYYKDMIENLIKERFDPKPYKFEDLKEGMWVWDDEERECRKILETYVTGEDNDVYVKGVRIVRHGLHEFSWKYSVFKEGRFFPITKALEYQK